MTIDPRSTATATLAVKETADVLVIGGGPAGLAAAIEAAQAGAQTVLVDENPVAPESMGEDIPLSFGGRAGGAVRNRNAMLEAMLASEKLLETALEAGVDVRLATFAWGLYANGPSVGWLPGIVAGLSDGAESWMLRCKSAIVAAGRRDMGLAFPGWEAPGVMGATAAERLVSRYGALETRRAIVLGTTAEALLAAQAIRRAGAEIVAVVEQSAAPVGPAALLEGLPVLTRHVIDGASSGPDGVTGAVLAALDEAGKRQPGQTQAVACDTIVLGIAPVPTIELLDAAGCKIVWAPERGGYVPAIDAGQMTSVPGVYAVGDCAGVWAGKSMDRGVAEAEGRRAAARALGRSMEAEGPVPADAVPAAYRLDWVRAAVVEAPIGKAEPYVCQCEEVTAREILEVRPPRYLGWTRPPRNSTDLTALLGEGPPNPDQVKRLTRAGMGLCQGRRCREQVAALLALGAGTGLDGVPLASYRAPVRPMPLGLAGTLPESQEMADNWQIWFGIEGQATPYWLIEPAGERK